MKESLCCSRGLFNLFQNVIFLKRGFQSSSLADAPGLELSPAEYLSSMFGVPESCVNYPGIDMFLIIVFFFVDAYIVGVFED